MSSLFWLAAAGLNLVVAIAQGFDNVNTVIAFWACMILSTIEREAS